MGAPFCCSCGKAAAQMMKMTVQTPKPTCTISDVRPATTHVLHRAAAIPASVDQQPARVVADERNLRSQGRARTRSGRTKTLSKFHLQHEPDVRQHSTHFHTVMTVGLASPVTMGICRLSRCAAWGHLRKSRRRSEASDRTRRAHALLRRRRG